MASVPDEANLPRELFSAFAGSIDVAFELCDARGTIWRRRDLGGRPRNDGAHARALLARGGSDRDGLDVDHVGGTALDLRDALGARELCQP